MNSLKTAFVIILFSAICIAVIFPRSSGAQVFNSQDPVSITAQELHYDREKNVYTARGQVEIVKGTSILTADSMLLDDNSKEAFAEGNVVFRDQGDVINAEKMTYHLDTGKGTIERGKVFVKNGNFYLTGDEMIKTGESTYAVHKGEFTTCGWDGPAWTFAARDVELTMGGYATAKHATFTIAGHKVFYFPWGIYPVKTERQSGFLMPEVKLSSRDGAVFRGAYFWAISKDKDATFFGDWIEKRGVKPAAEFRYALSETTSGSWFSSFINDIKYGHSRYELKGTHQQQIKDLVLKAEINHVSDIEYLKDLGHSLSERSVNSLRSVVFAEQAYSRSLLTGQVSYFEDLSRRDTSSIYQYLPAVSYFTEYLPFMKERLYGGISTDFTGFSREKGDQFKRLSIQPAVRLPYSVHGLNFLFSGGLFEKAYLVDRASDSNQTKHHEAVRLESDVNAQFIKNTNIGFLNLGNIESLIVPRIRYTYTKNLTSFSGIPSIDPSDRIGNTNTITYSVNHYLSRIRDGNSEEISLFEIEQTYGISGTLKSEPYLYEGSGNRFSDIRARISFFPSQNFRFTNEDIYNPYGKGMLTTRNSLRYVLNPIFQADLTHSYTKDLVNEVWVSTAGRWRSFDAAYQIRYSFIDNSWIDTLGSVTYHPSCWGVTLTVTKTRRPNDTSVHLSFSLQGITQQLSGF
jgi:LPS-assembly protein